MRAGRLVAMICMVILMTAPTGHVMAMRHRHLMRGERFQCDAHGSSIYRADTEQCQQQGDKQAMETHKLIGTYCTMPRKPSLAQGASAQ